MTPVDHASWRALTTPDRRMLLLLAVLQPLISASLRISGYANTKRRLQSLSYNPRPRTADTADLAQAGQLAHLAAVAGRRGPIRTTCLRQALAIYFLLRRKGLAPVIKLGVARGVTPPDMHAWVELEGLPLDQSNIVYASFAVTQD